jgi:hypothetical protein
MNGLKIPAEPYRANKHRLLRSVICWLGMIGSVGLVMVTKSEAVSDSNPPRIVLSLSTKAPVAESAAPISVIEAAQIIDKAEAREGTPQLTKTEDGMPSLAIDQEISVAAARSTVFPLSVNADGVLPHNSLIAIRGLPPGTVISAGRRNGADGWVLTPDDLLGALYITPGVGAAGASDVSVLLLAPDGHVARELRTKLVISGGAAPNNNANNVAPPPPAATTAEEIEVLLSHGRNLERVGYFAGARLFFQRAAEAGSAEGARALGETYDPVEFQKLGVHGLTPDPALAQAWYERARALEAQSQNK